MKKSFLYTVSVLALSGCGGKADNGWSNDCVKHHSETGREFKQCLEKLKRMKAAKAHAQERYERAAGARVEDREIPADIVSIDPEGTNMESFGREQGKKTRGSVLTPDAME